MRELQLSEITKKQVQILDVVVDFCDKNDIKYFICSGTLIGAVRHKGYIPWDDDIDLMMLRADYEKLISTFNHPDYTLFHYKRTPEYYYSFIKVSDNATKLVEFGMPEILNMGVNIDIFPVDNISSNRLKQKSLYFRKRLFEVLVAFNCNLLVGRYKNSGLLKKIIAYSIAPIVKMLSPLRYSTKKVDELAQSYSSVNNDLKARIVHGYGIKEVYKKSVFQNVTAIEFEGKLYNAPIDYHEYLTVLFGDYMQFPPIEQQVSNHNYKVFIK